MTALGINCSTTFIFLAVVQDGVVQDGHPERLAPPQTAEADQRLWATLEDLDRTLRSVRPDVAGLLLPEQTSKQTHSTHAPRIAMETVVRLAAVKREVRLDQLSRPTVRSLLGLPRRGPLEEQVRSVFPGSCGRYWRAGRGLAALAARAMEIR